MIYHVCDLGTESSVKDSLEMTEKPEHLILFTHQNQEANFARELSLQTNESFSTGLNVL